MSTFKTDSDMENPGFLPIMRVLSSEPLLPLAEGHSQQETEMGPGKEGRKILGFPECSSDSLLLGVLYLSLAITSSTCAFRFIGEYKMKM